MKSKAQLRVGPSDEASHVRRRFVRLLQPASPELERELGRRICAQDLLQGVEPLGYDVETSRVMTKNDGSYTGVYTVSKEGIPVARVAINRSLNG